ncbi:DUF2798 domain-containing protein [Noviherbaspirillum cavernae]|uniref:DUF2798 domain-containing protein n=1 Tax=Noviherbaspirillum cavernae TaxID=2320862 RepID=A0A418X5C1_9BURK|nr:DUF2798 domain-containing protein [Noviherbaspirillum cavernae]RJG07645.1 DUF2798 domain-containing protein [Noviherbaspirillum cavernae]
MTRLLHTHPAIPAVAAHNTPADAAKLLCRSRSLAAMLPWLLLTGVITLVVSAVMQATQAGVDAHFLGRWVEAWLTGWPIAFPIAYLLGPSLLKLAARMSAPAPRKPVVAGLSFDDIADASARVTARHGLPVRRKLKDARTIA